MEKLKSWNALSNFSITPAAAGVYLFEDRKGSGLDPEHPSGAEAPICLVKFMARLKPPQRRRPVAGDPGKSCPDTSYSCRAFFPKSVNPQATEPYSAKGKSDLAHREIR
jgi:hypothetical protein